MLNHRRSLAMIGVCVVLPMLALASGGQHRTIAVAPSPTPPDSAAGQIAYRDGASLYMINADGTAGKKFGDDKKYLYFCPVWSPDGKQLAVSGSSDGFEIYVTDANGSSQRTVLKKDNKNTDPPGPALAWGADGKQIFFASQNIGNVAVTDGKTVSPLPVSDVI